MTTRTTDGQRLVIAPNMATLALHCFVSARERKGSFAVVERRLQPCARRMAHAAVLWESGLHMIWVGCGVVFLGMAGITIRRSSTEFSVRVASGAFERGVHTGQGETGEFQVIEFRPHPTVQGMAALADDRKVQCAMVEHRGGVLPRVARITFRTEPEELARGRSGVAVLALQERMCTNQWESVLVFLDRLHPHLPSFDCVTRLAVCAELSPMDVGMAVRTFCSDVREHEAAMALPTHDALVHSP